MASAVLPRLAWLCPRMSCSLATVSESPTASPSRDAGGLAQTIAQDGTERLVLLFFSAGVEVLENRARAARCPSRPGRDGSEPVRWLRLSFAAKTPFTLCGHGLEHGDGDRRGQCDEQRRGGRDDQRAAAPGPPSCPLMKRLGRAETGSSAIQRSMSSASARAMHSGPRGFAPSPSGKSLPGPGRSTDRASSVARILPSARLPALRRRRRPRTAGGPSRARTASRPGCTRPSAGRAGRDRRRLARGS